MPAPKTIQIFLPDGDPQGLRTAEMTTRTVQVIDVPRKMLADFKAMDEAKQVGVYFLVGEAETGGPSVYVGQTGDLPLRLTAHHRNKDFWTRALVVVSRTNTLTQTHGLYLEWRSIAAVREAGRYADENGTAGGEPHTPPPLRAECDELFETIGPLLATLGHPMFEPVVRRATQPAASSAAEAALYFCDRGGADGKGEYTSEGFVVLAGSNGSIETPDYADRVRKTREELLDSSAAVARDGRFLFLEDHLFSSPSTAASVLVGKSSNGWRDWKTPEGRTLDEVERGGE